MKLIRIHEVREFNIGDKDFINRKQIVRTINQKITKLYYIKERLSGHQNKLLKEFHLS